MHAKKWNLAHLQLNKTFLFVDDDPAACSAARRMARLFGVEVQTANSAISAISLLEYNPESYFLVLADEVMPGMSGTALLVEVKDRWPYIRRALISGAENPEMLERGFQKAGIFKYIRKPMSDPDIRLLLEQACEAFLTKNVSFKDVVHERLSVMESSLNTGLKHVSSRALFSSFPQDYLCLCERGWRQAKRYHSSVSTQDSEQFQQFLSQRLALSIKKIALRCPMSNTAGSFRIAQLLRQFGVKCPRRNDRYVKGDESIAVAMCSTLRDYYSILGFDMHEMISAHEGHISVSLGGRFTYNDFFNPVLSSVERGAELACLKLEFFMLACLSNTPLEMRYSDAFTVRILL